MGLADVRAAMMGDRPEESPVTSDEAVFPSGAAAGLAGAVLAYREALDALASAGDAELTSAVRAVLLAREELDRRLTAASSLAPDALSEVVALDRRLQESAARISAGVGRATLTSWREAIRAGETAWWWRLDARAAADTTPSALWALATGLVLAASLSLAGEISTRFLSGGPDFWGIFSTLAQLSLALLAGSSFTQIGRQAVERTLGAMGIGASFHHRWRLSLALGVLGLILALRLALPSVAQLYNDRGALRLRDGEVTSATEDFQRAVSLDPDAALSHYNLGAAYDELLEHDKAIGAYQTSVRADPELYLAYNNLARLYLLRRNDPASALGLVDAALARGPTQPEVTYALRKNRGWANLRLNYYGQAEADLRQALTLRPAGAAAHCLLGQVLEARDRLEAALAAWEECLRYERSEVVEATWLGLARERVGAQGQAR